MGDLINISPVLYNLKKNYPSSEISIVCSRYNSKIASYYNDFDKILLSDYPLPFFLIKHFKNIFLKKYDLVLQLDGKKKSYLSGMLTRSSIKAGIKFIKRKKLFFYTYDLKRPNFLTSFSYNILEDCYEDYDISNNKSYHYLGLYLKILERLNLKIFSKKHFLPLKPIKKIKFDSYLHLHIDEKWLTFGNSFFEYFERKFLDLSNENIICVTSNKSGNSYFNRFKDKFIENSNFQFVNNISLEDLLNVIYHSKTTISSHAGLIVHAGAAFEKKIIDIVPENINNELDRWIPFDIDYKRINITNFFESIL